MTKSGRCTSYGDGQNSLFFLSVRPPGDFFPSYDDVSHTLTSPCTKLGTWQAAVPARFPLTPSVSTHTFSVKILAAERGRRVLFFSCA